MSNTVTSAFIDLATFDEIEKYLYNGPTAITYFVRCVRKSTWFAQVPVPLTQISGTPNFNSDVSWQISRAGDYLLHVWLRATLPAVSATVSTPSEAGTGIQWVANVGHNLIELAYITFNDLKVQEFDNYWLDIWNAFTLDASKTTGYQNMIGNVMDLTTPSLSLPQYTINVPLPFFFTRDTGIALPTAALPYNEMRITLELRDWRELLVIGPNTILSTSPSSINLTNVQLWANYAVVSNEERVKMGKCPRDMVIEQVQRNGSRSFTPATIGVNANASYDIRMSHSIKALFWVVANTTICYTVAGSAGAGNIPTGVGGPGVPANQARFWSNYTTSGCYSCISSADELQGGGSPPNIEGTDPIASSSLLYENTYRLFEMGSDYFSLVQPYYFWTTIPTSTGYHVYSFALHPESMDPSASTNFGKLTNVSLQITPSQDAVDAANGTCNSPVGSGAQTFSLHVRGLNFNIVRVSGGALGLPVL